MVAESWFHNLWKISGKHEANPEKIKIGVLAFEVASLMSKMVHTWHSLNDKQVDRLREEITNSVGIKRLVSEDEDYIVSLICAEIYQNMADVAKCVTRLGKKCSDPTLKGFKLAFEEFITMGVDTYGWGFTWKKMAKKVKKMERFISTNASLYQEMEVLADLEQTLRRSKANDESDGVNLLECHKKVAWKRQEVRNLREISLWNKTHDYTVHLLARSLFTIVNRIKHVFGIQELVDAGERNDSRVMDSDFICHSHSISALLQLSVHPADTGLAKYASGPIFREDKINSYCSHPIGVSTAKFGKSRNVNFYSGPLEKSITKSGPISATNKTSKIWKVPGLSALILGKKSHMKSNRLTQVGPFKGCMISGQSSSVTNYHVSSNAIHSGTKNRPNNANSCIDKTVHSYRSLISSKCKMLDAPPGTLGAAALALHYANVIIVIEKLAASPHLIGIDAREDLYNMLPSSVRFALREKLKPYTKSLGAPAFEDSVLVREWSEAMSGILEWLAPLAHNMIRWQSERSFEQQNFVSRTNVLLAQTLYFSDQVKTEAIITELLVGLNYVCRYGRELNSKALVECGRSRINSG